MENMKKTPTPTPGIHLGKGYYYDYNFTLYGKNKSFQQPKNFACHNYFDNNKQKKPEQNILVSFFRIIFFRVVDGDGDGSDG